MRIILLIIAVLILQSCALTFTCKLDRENPTSYIFNKDVEFIKETIKEKLGKKEFKRMSLCYNGKTYCNAVSGGILKSKSNINDFYLYSHTNIGRTKKYRSLFCHSKYEASFHIHIEYIEKDKTRITINTINPEIKVGYEFKRGDGHGFIQPRYKEIKPTTIEEYELLLLIGKYLGEENMPNLILP